MPRTENIKGLDVAQNFCNEWVLPFLKKEEPELIERAACALHGGSQCLGNDDLLSRDHGWGPAFQLFLTSEDARSHGKRLQRGLKDAAPREWLGAKWREVRPNVSVHSIDAWFRQHGGYAHPPKTKLAWLRIDESFLYMLRHATVFHDPLGEFSKRKQAFHSYPYNVWLQRVWDEMFSVWHYGEYNFIDRLTYRKDSVAITICLGEFTQSTMRLCLLLHDDYTPYWKWLAAEFRKLPDVEELDSWLKELAMSSDIDLQSKLIKTICRDVFSRLAAKGLVTGNPDDDEHCLKIAKKDIKNLMEQ